jgi:hypothetical protein
VKHASPGTLQRLSVVLIVTLVLLTVGGVAAASTPSRTTHRSSGSRVALAAATAPFVAPTDVVLSDSAPPWPLPSDARPYIAAAGLPILSAEQLDVHYHAHLDIVVNGAKVALPAGVGFVIANGTPTGITVLHTHDSSGVIHVESAKDQPYTLGQVFTEWGVALDATRVGGLHADADHVLATYVNGKRFNGDPATLRLRPHLEIALWYGTRHQTPHVPSSYHFPAGL